MKIALYTERLIIRSLEPHDWDDYLALSTNSEANQYVAPIKPERLIRQKFEARLLPWLLESGQWLSLIIETLDKEFVGITGFYCQCDVSKRVEVGYIMTPEMQGKGYATESLLAVIDWGNIAYDIHKYVAICAKDNVASNAVLLKCGFALEGHFINHTLHAGKWIDDYQYGLTFT
ncbi:GNAT family N-acetyltransferase [Shewanella gaetbuli]|uniref:GNAT family N-acetyltransferase n=1 Tax=Shewanella gaetbuli TaxID=220752 RepID=A0A9X2CHM0_9GAMM|nr:GNAT family protein [Shewanella gaetbuli]MCL1143658.1 GNAT family N-acetyltransferase [Shewanella gaetbuli]